MLTSSIIKFWAWLNKLIRKQTCQRNHTWAILCKISKHTFCFFRQNVFHISLIGIYATIFCKAKSYWLQYWRFVQLKAKKTNLNIYLFHFQPQAHPSPLQTFQFLYSSVQWHHHLMINVLRWFHPQIENKHEMLHYSCHSLVDLMKIR